MANDLRIGMKIVIRDPVFKRIFKGTFVGFDDKGHIKLKEYEGMAWDPGRYIVRRRKTINMV